MMERRSIYLHADSNNLPYDIRVIEYVENTSMYYDITFVGQEEMCFHNEVPQPLRMAYDVQTHDLSFTTSDMFPHLSEVESKLSHILMGIYL